MNSVDELSKISVEEYDDREKLELIVKQFANENYPDWENVHAYWGKESSKETSKQIVKK